MVKYLVTHAGRFHADDVCAAAILTKIFPKAEILRTRDDALLEQMRGSEAIIFDVGRMYNPSQLSFDHHMRDAAKREDGTIYSSFGLIWQTFGRLYLTMTGVPEEDIEATFHVFDEQIVAPIDKIDNGHMSPNDIGEARHLTLSGLIDSFNPIPGLKHGVDADQKFKDAVDFATGAIEAHVETLSANILMDNFIEEAIHTQWGKPVLELPYSVDAQKMIDKLEARHILFIIQPSSSGGFGLTCAREEDGVYKNLVDLPASWGGLSGQDLVDETGVEGVTFCHSGLFFAAGDTRESLYELARLAMPSPEPDSLEL
jgi:uncharacterized UPF0160 family protein